MKYCKVLRLPEVSGAAGHLGLPGPLHADGWGPTGQRPTPPDSGALRERGRGDATLWLGDLLGGSGRGQGPLSLCDSVPSLPWPPPLCLPEARGGDGVGGVSGNAFLRRWRLQGPGGCGLVSASWKEGGAGPDGQNPLVWPYRGGSGHRGAWPKTRVLGQCPGKPLWRSFLKDGADRTGCQFGEGELLRPVTASSLWAAPLSLGSQHCSSAHQPAAVRVLVGFRSPARLPCRALRAVQSPRVQPIGGLVPGRF